MHRIDVKNIFFVEYKLDAWEVFFYIIAVPINAYWQGLVSFFWNTWLFLGLGKI